MPRVGQSQAVGPILEIRAFHRINKDGRWNEEVRSLTCLSVAQ
jgi:hypothetical protein